jgi:hypothetical protein
MPDPKIHVISENRFADTTTQAAFKRIRGEITIYVLTASCRQSGGSPDFPPRGASAFA